MATEIVMAQVDGANQVSQLLAATGSKTFTVGKISAATGGTSGLVTLTPAGGGSSVALQLEGARQVADISALAGKTVAVGKPSLLAGAGTANNWLMFQPVTAGATKASASSVTLMKLEGTRQGIEAASLTGKSFTVVKPMMAGKGATSTLFLQPTGGGNLVALKMANGVPIGSSLVGKSVTIGQTPAVAGGKAGTWLALKPAAGVTAAKATGGAVACPVVKAKAVAMTAPAAKFQTVALTTAPAAKAATGATAAKGAAAGATAAKSAVAGGTIWKGTGLSLGLGLGLGALGPIIIAGVGVTAAYGYWRSHREEALEEVQDEALVAAQE